MRIPRRYAPIVFGALLSGIMVCIVSAVVLAVSRGIGDGFLLQWAKSALTTWPIAFPTVTLLAPWVRRIVDKVTV